MPPLPPPPPVCTPCKLDAIEGLLLGPKGASLAEIMVIAGWQAHSVRGVLAGALKKRGLTITSVRADGTRRHSATRGDV